jgi:hypothetical protein
MNSRRRILKPFPWIKEAYRGKGCKGTGFALQPSSLHRVGSNQSPSKFEPVSVSTGNSCQENVCRGQRRGRHFLATPVDSGRQRPRYPASPAAKPRNVKDYSDGARKPHSRGTAWWGW